MTVKDRIAEELLSVIQIGKGGIAQAVDLAYEQAPVLISQFLRYRLTKAIILLVVSLIAVFFLIKFLKKVWVFYSSKTERAAGEVILSIGVLIVSGLSLVILCNFLSVIRLIIAPKYYLIDFLMRAQNSF